jgi:hypothetical protein
MPGVRYKNHYISVVHLPDKSLESACTCYVEIRQEREQVLSTRLILGEGFKTEQDATERGFAVGKQWVDQRRGLKEAYSETAERSFFLRLRMRLSSISLAPEADP